MYHHVDAGMSLKRPRHLTDHSVDSLLRPRHSGGSSSSGSTCSSNSSSPTHSERSDSRNSYDLLPAASPGYEAQHMGHQLTARPHIVFDQAPQQVPVHVQQQPHPQPQFDGTQRHVYQQQQHPPQHQLQQQYHHQPMQQSTGFINQCYRPHPIEVAPPQMLQMPQPMPHAMHHQPMPHQQHLPAQQPPFQLQPPQQLHPLYAPPLACQPPHLPPFAQHHLVPPPMMASHHQPDQRIEAFVMHLVQLNQMQLQMLQQQPHEPHQLQMLRHQQQMQINHHLMHIPDDKHRARLLEIVRGVMLDEKPKRERTQFTAEQLMALEQQFEQNEYLVGSERAELAAQLQLKIDTIKVWFQNRRTKVKKAAQAQQGVQQEDIDIDVV